MILLQTAQPIIVRVLDEPVKEATVADLLIAAIGLVGVLVLAALVLGALLGGILIGVKLLRARYNLEPIPDSEALRVTPTSPTRTAAPPASAPQSP